MRKLSKQSLITLVELPPTQYGILNRDISFDIYSKSKLPARALPVLEAVLKAGGWENVESICPLDYGENEKLSSENFKRIFSSCVLLMSSITRTSPQSLELARDYKLVNPNGTVIGGGPDPTFRPEDWLRDVDIVVMGEGEKTISELMERLIESPNNLDDINGLAFKKGKEIEITKPRKLLTSEELSQLPHPFYNPKTRGEITTGVIETSRGCPNDCDFCTVTKFYGRQYRTKSIDYVIEEMKQIKDIGEYSFFTDDNLTAIPNRAVKLLEAIAENGLKKYSLAQTTIKLADKPELMHALKIAGIKALCIGIESINDITLQNYKKPYTAKQNKEAIKTLKKAGFWIHGMMMLGGEGDTIETLKETSAWINQNLDSAQLFSPIPIPGSHFFDKMKEQGRILTKDWSLYDGQHVITRPKHLTPYELQKIIYNMYEDFYSVKNSLKRLKYSPNRILSLEILAYTQVKGRKMLYNPQSNQHLEFLKSVS